MIFTEVDAADVVNAFGCVRTELNATFVGLTHQCVLENAERNNLAVGDAIAYRSEIRRYLSLSSYIQLVAPGLRCGAHIGSLICSFDVKLPVSTLGDIHIHIHQDVRSHMRPEEQ